jgi:hypothetical protein
MLKQFNDQIRECYERAAEATAKADETNDPTLKTEFLNIKKAWLILARSYGFTESLEHFTAVNSERQRKFDESLAKNI